MDPFNNNQKLINDFTSFFFNLQITMKLYHWSTNFYAKHKASDDFMSKLLEITDKFVEVFIGRYKVKPIVSNITINQDFINDNNIKNLLKEARLELQNFNNLINDSELLNIRDELLAEVNKTLYLFRLN